MDSKERNSKIKKVLIITLILNLSVCAIKIVLGQITGIFMITADGLHSLGDSLSNVVGLVGINIANKNPDKKFSYGYGKFEAITTLLIVTIISVTCFEVFENGIAKILHPSENSISLLMFIFIIVSILINIVTIVYEGGAGKKLKSELLIADSSETKSDVFVSIWVVLSIVAIHFTGWHWLDGLGTIIVGFMIIYVIWKIIKPTIEFLADAKIVEPEKVEEVVNCIDGVEFCHAIRSRGKESAFFLDLHLGVRSDISVEKAHDDICHRVKTSLYNSFPGLMNVMIHIEPNNDSAINRDKSVFKNRDKFGHK